MHALIHIGIEKTGSTAIQDALGSNREALDSQGVIVGWPPNLGNSRFIVSACVRKPDDEWVARGWRSFEDRNAYLEESIRWLDRELKTKCSSHHTAVISSEHFHSRARTATEMQAIRDFLAARFSSISIVCYVRPQSEVVASLYSTTLRGGSPLSFRQFARRVAGDVGYFDYDLLISRWRETFPGSKIEVRAYRPPESRTGNVVDDFFGYAGLALPEKGPSIIGATRNRRLSKPQAILMRTVNILAYRKLPLRMPAALSLRLRRRIGKSSGLAKFGKGHQADFRFTTQFKDSNYNVSRASGIPLSFWKDPESEGWEIR